MAKRTMDEGTGLGTATPNLDPTHELPPAGAVQETLGQAKDQVKNLASEAREQAKDLAGQAKDQAKEVANQARDHVQTLVGEQKNQAADRLGSLAEALREAGFDVPLGEERLDRAVEQGVGLARKLKRLPKFADWGAARKKDETLLTEWQVYRMFDARRGAWSTFQFLIKERLEDEGRSVGPDGRLR